MEDEVDDPYPLHTACRLGDAVLVRELISQGHMVNDGNFDLVQPLHEACFLGKIDCVRELLEAGAEVDGSKIDGSTPLCDACSSGHVECVRLLLERGANVNPQLLLTSPLHEAVLRDKHECAQILVDAGANLNHSDCHFGTPLHAAVYKKSINCIKILLKAGCDVNYTWILTTPLHLAARQLHLAARQLDDEIVSLLLEFGADPRMTNDSDLKARDMVPTSTSHIKQQLLYWEENPRSLKFLCRQIIRECLGRSRLQHTDKLHLPSLLEEFVLYKYL